MKAINDYFDHTAGDWFVRVLAERLREGADGPNLIARLGGDEFVVVPTAPMDSGTAEALAYRLQQALCERLAIDGEIPTRAVRIGVPLGVSTADRYAWRSPKVLWFKTSRTDNPRRVDTVKIDRGFVRDLG